MDLTIPAVSGATIHYNLGGEQDYWCVKRQERDGPVWIVPVVPILRTAAGVKVHSMHDNPDYIITEAGKWLGYDAYHSDSTPGVTEAAQN